MRSSSAAARFEPAQHVRTFAEELRLGMFVSALDRPWADTPFLIQGFLVDSEIELATLRRYCRYVFVDLDLSRADAVSRLHARNMVELDLDLDLDSDTRPLDTIPYAGRLVPPANAGHAEPAASPGVPPVARAPEAVSRAPEADTQPPLAVPGDAGGRPQPKRADVRITRETRARFRRLVRGVPEPAAGQGDSSLAKRAFDRLRSMMRGSSAASRSADAAPADSGSALFAEVTAALPPGVALRTYVDRRSVAEELPRARTALARSDEAIAALVTDIRAGRAIELWRIEEAVGRLVDSAADNPDALQRLLQPRTDRPTQEQGAVRFAVCMMTLGRHVGFPKPMLRQLGMIGMLSDVGKTRLPRELLEKPGMLSAAEYSIVKEHVRLGLELLSRHTRLDSVVASGIAEHHERLDGSGYPKGLAGGEISIYGRMAAIADNYSALIASRGYASALAPQDALMSLYQWGDSLFDGALVERFVEAIGAFPVGSLVELSSGEVAMVLTLDRARRLEPRVLVLTRVDKCPLPMPFELDLTLQVRDDSGRRLRLIRGLPAGAHGLPHHDHYADRHGRTAPP